VLLLQQVLVLFRVLIKPLAPSLDLGGMPQNVVI
jgi:hypothetical protein